MGLLNELYGAAVEGFDTFEPGTADHNAYTALYILANHNGNDHVVSLGAFMNLDPEKVKAFQQFYRLLIHFSFAVNDPTVNPVKLLSNGDRVDYPEMGDLIRHYCDNVITMESIDEIYNLYADMSVRVGYWHSPEESKALSEIVTLDDMELE